MKAVKFGEKTGRVTHSGFFCGAGATTATASDAVILFKSKNGLILVEWLCVYLCAVSSSFQRTFYGNHKTYMNFNYRRRCSRNRKKSMYLFSSYKCYKHKNQNEEKKNAKKNTLKQAEKDSVYCRGPPTKLAKKS